MDELAVDPTLTIVAAEEHPIAPARRHNRHHRRPVLLGLNRSLSSMMPSERATLPADRLAVAVHRQPTSKLTLGRV
jgi:hypothetical protein